jgi:hypothetical protein
MRFTSQISAITLVVTGWVGMARAAEPVHAAAAPAAAAAPTAAAPALPPSPPSKPATENDALKFLTGSWACEGTANLGPGKSVKIKATAKTKSELGGFWQSFVYTEKKSKDYPMAITAIGTWGWDATSKKFVRAEFQSTGGYVTGTSSGWAGDTFTWDLEISSFMGKMNAKHIFTKKSDKEFVHKIDASLPGAPAPVTLFEVTCKK